MPFLAFLGVGLLLGAGTALLTHRKPLPIPALGSIPYKFVRSSPAVGGGGGGFDPPKPLPVGANVFGGVQQAVAHAFGAAVSAAGVSYGGSPVAATSPNPGGTSAAGVAYGSPNPGALYGTNLPPGVLNTLYGTTQANLTPTPSYGFTP
jgi:hypothetical protein